MKLHLLFLLLLCTVLINACTQNAKKTVVPRAIWTKEKANNWYAKQPWLVGANFMPSTAINQLEMWQGDSFDTLTIDKELALGQSIGMNTMRVFLHDLVFQEDSAGFVNRIDKFLQIAQRHQIKPILVIFDSCWDPFPAIGKQRAPKPFTHNSGWVQSPGQLALKDTTQRARLEHYVKSLIAHFAADDRILAWDVWNEPDNMTGPSYEKVELKNKVELVIPLLKKTFEWARSANPSQPVTSGIWVGDWSDSTKLKPIEQVQLSESDIITFHNYDKADEFERRIIQLQRYGKPIICTEYMARPNGSTFATFLPIAKKYRVGMYNWGFVNGKTQTIYPWDSWTKAYTAAPPLWFHDIFNTDGSPYKKEETDFIRKLTGEVNHPQ